MRGRQVIRRFDIADCCGGTANFARKLLPCQTERLTPLPNPSAK
jgi:hypothetical protein